MKRYVSKEHFRLLHPRTRGRPTPPAQITDESKARGARRRRIEALSDERDRRAGIDHFADDDGLPAEELP